MAWLLDTNVLSELHRPRLEQRVVAFVAGLALEQLYISAVTLSLVRDLKPQQRHACLT
jgi:predicted nucleic acid-binding protein